MNDVDIAGQHESLAGRCAAAGSSPCGGARPLPALQSSSAHHLHAGRNLRMPVDR